ncbi:MAG: tryptophan 2,3-dioxygenase family protein [Bdellovibrio sp.]|jgi:tryptophan 2,3-dioxygenase
MKYPPVHYHDYLGIDALLGSQKRRSEDYGNPAHDEMLFIIVHQAYELWFKQVLFELDSVLETFSSTQVDEKKMGRAVARLERVRDIITHTIGQIDILETMTPMDFLDFRDYLYPASGFQSFQWRMIETKLGLQADSRLAYSESPFWKSLHPTQQASMKTILGQKSLFELLEAWLERTPFLSDPGFDFWNSYEASVVKVLAADEDVVRANPRLNDADKEKTLKGIEVTRQTYLNLFNPEKYKELQAQGLVRFSAKALQGALFIQIYRDEPILQLPFRLLSCLIDLDEKMTEWRYRHALMAQRMLGKKIGTGGSSGHEYLKSATEKHKIFSDLVNLASFMIPHSQIPELPESIRRQMNYFRREQT